MNNRRAALRGRRVLISVLLLLAIFLPGGRAEAAVGATPHIFVIMMENKEQSEVIGNRAAPYINSLVKQYGFAANYHGVTHPSLPNYVATIAGDYFGVQDDSDANRFPAMNLVDQLEAHHLSWKAYMESVPTVGFTGDTFAVHGQILYDRKHNPFMLMTDIVRSAARRRHVVPAGTLRGDLASGKAPNLVYLTPNLCHDMHGIDAAGSPCPSGDTNGLIQIGDRYLGSVVPLILHSRAWTANSLLVIAWDEGASNAACCSEAAGSGGGLVPAIVIAREGARGFTSRTPYNHYSLLATVQTLWHLGCLAHTCDRHAVRPLTEFLHR